MKISKSQSQNFNCTNDRGITLVALIITIIILIILAAVTINSLTHEGLANMAINGTQDYDKAQASEMNMLNAIDSMVKETIKNLEDGTNNTIHPYVGKTIDYVPAGQTYDIAATTYSGYSTAQSFSTSDITGGWQVWDIDSENIYIISTQSTGNGSKKLYLSNYQGYNNGVTLLDELCDTCFTNKTVYAGITGRSLKLSDITAVTTLKNADTKYGSTPDQFNIAYPWIWDQYEKSDPSATPPQGTKDWENNRETAYELTTSSTVSSTFTPYRSRWYNDHMNTETAWTHQAYYNMVMSPVQTSTSSNNYYWLSSRCIYPVPAASCYFGLQRVYSSGVSYLDCYKYNKLLRYSHYSALRGCAPASSNTSIILHLNTKRGRHNTHRAKSIIQSKQKRNR